MTRYLPELALGRLTNSAAMYVNVIRMHFDQRNGWIFKDLLGCGDCMRADLIGTCPVV